jgi:chromosome segregation ATPase
MSKSAKHRHQQLVENDETETVRGYDSKLDAGIQNVDDDEKSVMLKIITQVPVDPEHRDDTDARESAEDPEEEELADDGEYPESEYPDSGYSQRKAILEQVLSEYDQQHQQEKKLYQNKIAALKRSKEQQKSQHGREINALKEDVEDKFNLIKTSMEAMEETVEMEREERSASFREIEEHLLMRDNEVEGLLKIIAMQGEELEQAKTEREELKKEMQNILLTIHTQFERYDEKGFKSNAELSVLREEHTSSKKLLTEEVGKLKQCMCMIQENIDEARKENSEMVAETKNKISTAQKDTQAQLHKLLDAQQSVVSGYLERNNDKFEKIYTDIKSIRMELGNHQELCDKLGTNQSITNDRMKSAETAIMECRTAASELNNYVYNDAAKAIDTLMSEKESNVESLNSLSETMARVQSSISEINNKVNADKLDMEFMEVKLKDGLNTLEQKLQEQEVFLTTEITSTNESVKTVVELMGSKLSDLRSEIYNQETAQYAMNQDFLQKNEELTEALEMKHRSIELSNQEISEMIETMKGFAQMHGTLKAQFLNSQEKHKQEVGEIEMTMKGLHTKVEGIMKMIQQRAEVQSLANKDFKTTQDDFALKLKSCGTQLSTLERRMTHAEESLCNTVSAGLVDVMMQPYLSHNEQIGEVMKKQSDELKAMRDQVKMTQADRASITEKVDDMNKTWESLFQHLAGQMQKDTVDINKMKKEVDASMKDIKRMASVWEKNLESVVKNQGMSQHVMSLIKGLQSDVESCNGRVTDLFHEIRRQQKSNSTELGQLSEENTSKKKDAEMTRKNELQASVERLLNV